MRLPVEIVEIIMDYKYGLEHYERFAPALCGIRYVHFYKYVVRGIQMELYLY